MLSEENIEEIAVSGFEMPKGSHFSIKSGLKMSFPNPENITDDEIAGINCKNCPIYEYREDTVNKPEGWDRRSNIRCDGMVKEKKILGEIYMADFVDFETVEYFFGESGVTPCGIPTVAFRQILMSTLVRELTNDADKLGLIMQG